MLIRIEDIYNYITPKQAEQFLAINPQAFEQAYADAVGYLTAQIGNVYNLPVMLSETEDPDSTLLWMVRTLTAYNISGSAMKQSEPLIFNVRQVYEKIHELKSGASSLVESPKKPEPNALGAIVSVMDKYRG